MRTAVVLLVLSSTALLAARPSVPSFLLRDDVPPLETRITIRPVNQNMYHPARRWRPDLYQCSAVIVEGTGESRRAWGPKAILLGRGESGEETRTSGPIEVRFRVSINDELDTARASVIVTRNGQRVLTQTSHVVLTDLRDQVRPFRER